jgi:hypothetical protein
MSSTAAAWDRTEKTFAGDAQRSRLQLQASTRG